MCGIVGYVGNEDAVNYVIEGLRRLEYRGYDSTGIATIDHGVLRVLRRKGKLEALVNALLQEPLRGNVAIGHTRWATHGKPSDANAHPHRVDDVVVVHNGIIENCFELRHQLEAQGRKFNSDTDTEVISHLIALAPDGPIEERVRHALQHIHGAYALAVLSTREPHKLVVTKNASPLIIGIAENAHLVASDIPALLPFTRRVLVMNEGEMAVLRADGYDLMTIDGKPLSRPPQTIEWSLVMAEKGGYKHFMHKEIHEQPRALADTFRGRLESDGHIELDDATLNTAANVSRIMITACGTSWHAGLVARLVLEELTDIHCEIELASELRYRHTVLGPSTMVLAISQSGETADTLAAIKSAREQGSPILSVVNVLDSSISRASDHVLYTHAGPEIGVASTKAFTTQVAVLLLFALSLAHRKGRVDNARIQRVSDQLRHIPLQIENILQREDQIIAIAQAIHQAHSAFFLGRGVGQPVALEGALKLKEVSYIHAEGYAAGEMKHGPIALLEPGVPVICIATQGPLYDKMLSNLQEARTREASIIAIATEGDERIKQWSDHVFYIPPVDPMLMPLVATIPLQLLAYHVADLRGTDVDQPRNLAKSVTVE